MLNASELRTDGLVPISEPARAMRARKMLTIDKLMAALADEAVGTFETFYQHSRNGLEDISFLFQPVLPDDEIPLTERMVAVGEW